MSEISDKMLRELYDQFCYLFSDHPNEENVVLYLVKWELNDDNYNLLWTCSHFEDGDLGMVVDLASFMFKLALISNEDVNYAVDLVYWDIHTEKIIIKVDNVIPDIVIALMKGKI